ncbi:MAG: hypothetical protein QM778_36680 [Myxococcales bacterium]
MRRALTVSWFVLGLSACSGPDPVLSPEPTKIGVSETREVELRFLRFDVSNFEKRLTRADILALPKDAQERLWLLDLDLSSGASSPQLLDNSLAAIRALDPNTLGQAERNMQALLTMTPDTAVLTGTDIERLIDLAPLLGVAPEQVLADLFHINVEDPFLSDRIVAQTVLDQVIMTHPNTRMRAGPITEEHPDGMYPVAQGAIPVTLGDVASDFVSLGERFGPYEKNGVTHPGFVAGQTRASVLTDDFAITVRANANALPYKGIDLTNGSDTSVNSVRSQIKALFDFDDPNWLRVEGLVEGIPKIDQLSFRIVESDGFVEGGRTPVPTGIGSSPAWELPPWTLERVLIGAAQRAFSDLSSEVSYTSPGKNDPIFKAVVEKGWQTISVQGGLGSPPPSSYVWDMLLEIAQVRLHDGNLPEGTANVEFKLENIPVGTDTATLEQLMRQNLQQNPYSLLDIAEEIIDTTEGAADFYYYRSSPSNLASLQGDWLFFVNQDDIAVDDQGQPVRPYNYTQIGFFSDAALTNKVSSLLPLDGDTDHEKVRLDDHPELYMSDDAGAVFKLTAGGKPSPNRRHLTITRVR